jgi:CheY-like chemotaxis protein
MDPTTMEQAFEPFFTTKPAGQGTGLGLSMVHGIIHELGGTVWLDSAPGHGTTVACLLPIAPESLGADQDEVVAENHQTSAAARILYVDDERALLSVGQRRLAAAGHRVTAIQDPTEALRVFGEDVEGFDLVITDFSMPRMDGMDLARAISALRPGTPILLITGYMQDFPVSALAEAGIQRVLNKPVTASALLDAVDSVRERR